MNFDVSPKLPLGSVAYTMVPLGNGQGGLS